MPCFGEPERGIKGAGVFAWDLREGKAIRISKKKERAKTQVVQLSGRKKKRSGTVGRGGNWGEGQDLHQSRFKGSHATKIVGRR